MKTPFTRLAMSTLRLLALSLCASPCVVHAETPKGLSPQDWSDIRAARDQFRHTVVKQQDGSFTAHNPGQDWNTRFDGTGFTVQPSKGEWVWGLELTGYGYPGNRIGLDQSAEPRQEGSRMSCDRDANLTEWFVNDGRGLEQGWTIRERPHGGGGPLELELLIRGGLKAHLSGADGVEFADPRGASRIRYSGLKAWDADGRKVGVRFALNDARADMLSVCVDDAGARYPVTIDPIAQQAYLKASNAEAGDNFGSAVAISGDTVVVGAYGEGDNASGMLGAAYVFVRSGGLWEQQAYLKGSVTINPSKFGASVAIYGDTIVVGESSMSGAAYVFVRTGSIWSRQAKLQASNAESYDYFGTSVSISGERIVVGAIGEDSGNGDPSDNSATESGAAYVFIRNGSTWSQQAYLKAANCGNDDRFGGAVSISGDSIVVGAHRESSSATGVNGNSADNSASTAGAAYVFVRNGTSWSQQAYLKASNTELGDAFGSSVSISGDTVAVGAPIEGSSGKGVNGSQGSLGANLAPKSGAAYLFTRSGSAWSQQAYIKSSNSESGDRFGTSLALSGDTLVIGATGEDGGTPGLNGDQADNSLAGSGAAYLFIRSSGIWSQNTYIKASNPNASDEFGGFVAVSGTLVVVGASQEDSSSTGVNGNQADNAATAAGAAYLFEDLVSYTLSGTAANGSITGTGDYAMGSSATITAVPQPGYVFTGWTGDGSGAQNPLSITMDANKQVGASFSADTRDSDGDGLTNFEESVQFGTNPDLPDTDGDGFSDGFEIAAHFNPLASSSTPESAPSANLAMVGQTPTLVFRFNAASGRIYRIEASKDLVNWSTLEIGINGTGGTITRSYSTENESKRYFRAVRN